MTDWHDISTVPRDGTPFQARIPGYGDDNFIAYEGGLLNSEGDDCYAWVWTDDEKEPPADWTDGVCWSVNENGVSSTWPTHWRVLV